MKTNLLLIAIVIIAIFTVPAKSETHIELGNSKPCNTQTSGCPDTTVKYQYGVIAENVTIGDCSFTFLADYFYKTCLTTDPFAATLVTQIANFYIISETSCDLTYEDLLGVAQLQIWKKICRERNLDSYMCSVNQTGCVTELAKEDDVFVKLPHTSGRLPRATDVSKRIIDSLNCGYEIRAYKGWQSCTYVTECCITYYKVDYDFKKDIIKNVEVISRTVPSDTNMCKKAYSPFGVCSDGCRFSYLKFNLSLQRQSEQMNTETKQSSVYPNPSDGLVKIYIPEVPEGFGEFTVSNALGNSIYSQSFNQQEADFYHEVDLSGVPSGVYFYTLKFQDKTYNGILTISK